MKKYFDALTKVFSQYGLHWEIISKGTSEKFKGAEGLYLNYLEVGNLIVVPEYGIPEDEIAYNELSIFFLRKLSFHLNRIVLQKQWCVAMCELGDKARISRSPFE